MTGNDNKQVSSSKPPCKPTTYHAFMSDPIDGPSEMAKLKILANKTPDELNVGLSSCFSAGLIAPISGVHGKDLPAKLNEIEKEDHNLFTALLSKLVVMANDELMRQQGRKPKCLLSDEVMRQQGRKPKRAMRPSIRLKPLQSKSGSPQIISKRLSGDEIVKPDLSNVRDVSVDASSCNMSETSQSVHPMSGLVKPTRAPTPPLPRALTPQDSARSSIVYSSASSNAPAPSQAPTPSQAPQMMCPDQALHLLGYDYQSQPSQGQAQAQEPHVQAQAQEPQVMYEMVWVIQNGRYAQALMPVQPVHPQVVPPQQKFSEPLQQAKDYIPAQNYHSDPLISAQQVYYQQPYQPPPYNGHVYQDSSGNLQMAGQPMYMVGTP